MNTAKLWWLIRSASICVDLQFSRLRAARRHGGRRQCCQRRDGIPAIWPPGERNTKKRTRETVLDYLRPFRATRAPRQRVPELLVIAVVYGVFVGALTAPRNVHADVIVLANRTAHTVTVQISQPQGQAPAPVELDSGAVVPIPVAGTVQARFATAAGGRHYDLAPNAAYYLAPDLNGQIVLHEIDLGRKPADHDGAANQDQRKVADVGEIPVKILVDAREPTTRKVWEPRLRKRVAAASRILQRTCRVRLKIVAVEQWRASPSVQDVQKALAEFQRAVHPDPAWVAIGFTSMYRDAPGRFHLGGARGLLRSHILIRERSPNMTEIERLEILVHELGHYLGAVHSPDPNSVMRPLLGDDKSALKAFRIRFDPVNTLITHMVGEEIRRGVHRPARMSLRTRRRLEQIYQAICQANPSDRSARQMQFQLALGDSGPRVQAARQVVHAIVAAATEHTRKQLANRAAADGPDALTRYYVRRAAAAAGKVPPDVAGSALLLGLGIALDTEDMLRRNALTREFCAAVESEDERRRRHQVLQAPTIHGRKDLAQHFFLSAYLTVVAGPKAAETAGIGKELLDAQGGSGFSYVDLAADLAGIALANYVLADNSAPAHLADHFTVPDFMPAIDDLPEGLRWDQVWPHLRGDGNQSLNSYRSKIHSRIQQLPGRSQRPPRKRN